MPELTNGIELNKHGHLDYKQQHSQHLICAEKKANEKGEKKCCNSKTVALIIVFVCIPL